MDKEEGILMEGKRQLRLGLPLTLANLLMFALQFLSIAFVGHISHEKLAGASVGICFVNAVGFSALMGVSLALDTLCGQSFGAKQYKQVGLHLQRAMVVTLLASVPLGIVLAFSGQILVLLGQVPHLSMSAQSFVRWMIPSLFAYGLLQCILRFLQAQNIVLPIMLSSGLTALLHLLGCWVFTYKTGLGYKGAALSVSVSYWFNLLLLLLYVCYSHSCKETWTGFSREAFSGLLGFLKLGIPSTFMVCLQNWQFELLLLLSGFLSNPDLQTSLMSISQNTSSLVYVIPLGVSAAISTRVSNELGSGNPKAAKLAVFVASSTIVAEGLVVGLVLISFRKIWGQIYSQESQVEKAVASMMPWIALSHFFDGFQCVLLGTIRGCGRQKIGALVCLCSYYAVGIPASILLGFVLHKGVKGLWIGNICAIFVQDLVLIIFTILTDWEKQTTKANERMQNDAKPSNTDFPDPSYWICNIQAYKCSSSVSLSFE